MDNSKKIIAAIIAIGLHVAVFGVIVLASSKSKNETGTEVGHQTMITDIEKHAVNCVNAQLKKDIPQCISYIPPKLLELMGGKEGFTNDFVAKNAAMKARGIVIDSVTIGTPEQPKQIEDLMVGLVPQKMTLKTQQGKLVTDSHLLAVSQDAGKTWMFVECAMLNQEKLGVLYPALKGKIELPAAITKVE